MANKYMGRPPERVELSMVARAETRKQTRVVVVERPKVRRGFTRTKIAKQARVFETHPKCAEGAGALGRMRVMVEDGTPVDPGFVNFRADIPGDGPSLRKLCRFTF